MKARMLSSVLLCVLTVVPQLASASNAVAVASNEATKFVDKLNTIIVYPTIGLLASIALLVFIWGVAEYFIHADNDQARQVGVKHITWGIIGLVIMMSAFTILQIVVSTFDLGDELDCADNPSLPGCKTKFKVTAPNVGS
jgi:hypothetical protein